MAAQEEAALLIEHGNLYVGDDEPSKVNLGSVRNVVFTAEPVNSRINSDNNGTILNKVRQEGTVGFDWLEIGNADHINELFKGVVTKSAVAGTPVAAANFVIASPFTADLFYKITGQNNDGTKQTINSVTGSTDGALVANDDYSHVQDANGNWGIVMNTVAGGTTLTTLTQTITVDYDYTPAASQIITGGTSQTATDRYVEIRGPSEDDAALERIIVLNACVAESPMLIPFVDVETANDVGVMPVLLRANKGTVWTFTDEINPS